jgi:hypothetical protein
LEQASLTLARRVEELIINYKMNRYIEKHDQSWGGGEEKNFWKKGISKDRPTEISLSYNEETLESQPCNLYCIDTSELLAGFKNFQQ